MRWLKLLDRYSLVKRPTLRIVNPRMGTSTIPLDHGDDQIFFQYLTNKLHSLYFEGTESQLTSILFKLRDDKGFTIEKMKTSARGGKKNMVLLHLKFPDNQEIRRLINLA